MRDSIIHKIALHLEKGIETEADCVYLLSQVRKYLEQQNIKDYWNLRMCTNWCLHSTLDTGKNEAVRLFLEEINEFLIDAEKGNGYDLEKHPDLKNRLMFATGLKDELKQFLAGLGINTNICDEAEKSANFLSIFGRVIEDTPLVCKANKPLSHLSEISFSKRKAVIDSGLEPESLYWTIKKNNDMTLLVSINKKTIDMGIVAIDVKSFIYIENKSD